MNFVHGTQCWFLAVEGALFLDKMASSAWQWLLEECVASLQERLARLEDRNASLQERVTNLERTVGDSFVASAEEAEVTAAAREAEAVCPDPNEFDLTIATRLVVRSFNRYMEFLLEMKGH